MNETIGPIVFIVMGVTQLVLRKRFTYFKISNRDQPPSVRILGKEVDVFQIVIVLFSTVLILTGSWSLMKTFAQ